MDKILLKIKVLSGGIAPKKMTLSAVGYDIFARLDEPVVLHPGERGKIPAGFAIEIPDGYEAQIRPRSGLAVKYGLTMLNSPGTIDPDYRGEVSVILANLGGEDIIIQNGARIAQMIIASVANARFEIVKNLSKTSRGEGGFGSTGS